MESTRLVKPGVNCAWFKTLRNCAWNSKRARSVKLKCFPAVRSRLLMGLVDSVFLPVLAKAPFPAVMYSAVGLLARYATIKGVESKFPGPGAPFLELKSLSPHVAKLGSVLLQRGLTPEPVPGTPAGLRMARSPAESPFRLASMPLCTSAGSPTCEV